MNEGLLTKSGSVAAPAVGVTLSKLRKDALLTAWDRYAWDCMHPTSWPSQANPGSLDALVNLAGTISSTPADPGSFGGSPLVTFDDGFHFSTTAPATGSINLPAVCKPATTSRGYIHMVWMLIPETTSIRKVFGWGASGAWAYGVYFNNVLRQFVIYADGSSSIATFTLAAGDFNLAIGGTNYAVVLFCVGRCEDGAGGFLKRARVYTKALGFKATYSAAAGATATQSANATANIGYSGAFGANIAMRAYRGRHVDVQAEVGVATSAWWDALCDAEFAGNVARTDWNVT